jgi:tetratricopeptide (TPR) repeat protein
MHAAKLLADAERAFRSGDAAHSERLLKRVLSSDPASTKANELLAYILGNRGDLEGALRRLEVATSRPGASRESWYYLGTCLRKKGLHRAAETALAKSLALGEAFFEGVHDLGLVRFLLGEASAALECYDRAIAMNPRSVETLYNRGRALDELRRYDEALRSYDAALVLDPRHVPAWTNRGAALHDLGRCEDALSSFDKALELAPGHVEAWLGRGLALHDMKRYDEALECFGRGSELAPGNADVQWRESFTHLILGDFREGWRKYEARWRRAGADPVRHAHLPLWLGAPELRGKRVLAWAEQGHGDTIQFCRYVDLLAREGAEVILEVQPPLRTLMSSLAGCTVVGQGDAVPACDFQIPLLSLPNAFGTRPETIPARVPYLSVDPHEAGLWRRRMQASDTRIKVGIACSGSPGHRKDALRSVPLEKFAALQGAAELFVVQRDLRADDDRWLRASGGAMRDPGDRIADFRDAAAIVANLDLVICVDTSLGHLAGALGKPVWILLPWAPDWRWLAEGSTTSWYPTATLFRQQRPGHWGEVFEAVREALARWSESACA